MDRATLGDVQLEYELRGGGEPVLLIHPGIFADWFTPLFGEAALTRGYKLLHYHRAGCVGSGRIAGPTYCAALDEALPDAFDQHVADAATFFEQELPALQQWSFRRDHAQRIAQPALAVVGSLSLEMDPIWNERQQLLLDWLPNVEPLVIPGAAHLMGTGGLLRPPPTHGVMKRPLATSS
jgi:hypothetical protein